MCLQVSSLGVGLLFLGDHSLPRIIDSFNIGGFWSDLSCRQSAGVVNVAAGLCSHGLAQMDTGCLLYVLNCESQYSYPTL
uniref:Uncharacterized protein n=1 Tax=Rhizophora mucronata TaxID=61149 RepID=A0A2P2L9V3_RHIMU